VPRLTNAKHYITYHFLHRAWNLNDRIFSIMTPKEQWEFHDFYQPSKHLTSAELTAHLMTVTTEQPSLPARAGKTFRRFYTEMVNAATNHPPRPGTGALVRPEIDTQKLARACIALARLQLERQR